MAKSPSYPRINCCVKGCKRGTTKCEPGVRIICGKCWRRAPQDMRQLANRWRLRARRFYERGDEHRAVIAGRWATRAFDNVLAILNGQGEEAPGVIPPLMAEELRKAGLA